MLRYLWIIIPVLFTHIAWAEDCTMRPAPINAKRFARNPIVKSYAVNMVEQSVTALLKNGQVLRLVHSGCEHSGATASLWIPSKELPMKEVWVQQAIALSRLAFEKDSAADIERGLQAGKFDIQSDGARNVINLNSSTFMSTSIVVVGLEQGWMITISYVLG